MKRRDVSFSLRHLAGVKSGNLLRNPAIIFNKTKFYIQIF